MPIEVSGQEAVEKAFKDLIKAVDASELSLIAAEIIFDESQKIVPVDTGELRDSGEVKQEGDDAKVIYSAEHAPYIEFGTSKQAAQPYLRPAMDNHRVIIAGVTTRLKQQIGE